MLNLTKRSLHAGIPAPEYYYAINHTERQNNTHKKLSDAELFFIKREYIIRALDEFWRETDISLMSNNLRLCKSGTHYHLGN